MVLIIDQYASIYMMVVKLKFILNKLVIIKFNNKSLGYNMNQYDNKKIQQKICMYQTDLTFSQSNCRHKQAKFDLILNKNVKLQLQEEVKK